jgi:hypothetical protein
MGQAGVKRVLILGTALAALLLLESPAMARHRMSFVPGRHGHAVAAHWHRQWRPHRVWHGRATARHAAVRRAPVRSGRPSESSVPVAPPPGSGFKMEDGVLTYPAPARFQPQNLKHLH